MQKARRTIICTLLLHSGCLSLGLAEFSCLTDTRKGFADRPSGLLLEIWKAAQRVIEHTIRRKQEHGISYTTAANGICAKAEFLLRIEPCQATQAAAVVLAPLAADIVLASARTSGSFPLFTKSNPTLLSETEKICSGLILPIMDFLQSSMTPKCLTSLEIALNTSNLRAICGV